MKEEGINVTVTTSIKVLRTVVETMTTSFRYPRMVVGKHLTLPVPPVSTILGFLSAAAGKQITLEDTFVGYIFQADARFEDLEQFYQLEVEKPLVSRSNILKRQQFYMCQLILYTSLNMRPHLERPHHPVFLGRSTDLAYIHDPEEIVLEQRTQVERLGKTALPAAMLQPKPVMKSVLPAPAFNANHGLVMSMPTSWTDEHVRRPIHVARYFFVDHFFRHDNPHFPVWYDPEKDWGVWLHGAVPTTREQQAQSS